MPKFFVSPDKVNDGIITIDTKDVGHIKRVLRLGEGDIITVCDSTGTDYNAKISKINENAVLCDVISSHKNSSEPNIEVTIYQALPKASKMEYIIQKNTELGVARIVPCSLSRCVVKLDGADGEKKRARWQKIAAEAAKQCGRGQIPEIAPIHTLPEVIEQMHQADLCFIPYECEKTNSLKKILQNSKNAIKICYLIGPEGGFAPEEISAAAEAGIPSITLGPRILRTETAGEAVLAMLMYELGDINQ